MPPCLPRTVDKVPPRDSSNNLVTRKSEVAWVWCWPIVGIPAAYVDMERSGERRTRREEDASRYGGANGYGQAVEGGGW